MLSFSNFVLHEDVKKNQIKTLFSNLDLKIGLEFEFFNEDFVKQNDIPDTSEAIALDDLSDELLDLKEANQLIMRDNLHNYSQHGKIVSAKMFKDLLGYKKVVSLLGTERTKSMFNAFSRHDFSKLEVTELIHYSIFVGVIDGFVKTKGLRPETLDKTGAKPGQLKLDIYHKYKKNSSKFKKFQKIINDARTSEITEDVPFSLIKKYYSSVENLPACVKNPLITDSTRKGDSSRWVIKTDTSVAASKGGIEFISPIMTPTEALTATQQIFEFISKVGHTNSRHLRDKKENPRTNQCGLHINISMKGEQMKRFDALKFIIFSNEGQIKNEKLFGDRQDTVLIRPVLETLRRYMRTDSNSSKRKMLTSTKMKLGSAFMNNKIQILGKYNNVNTTAYRPNNRTIRRKKDERIEVRFFGGEDYHKKYSVFKRVLGELLHAMDVATDPDKEVKKYYKSLYKIINDVEKKDEN